MMRHFGISLVMLLGLALVSSPALARDHGHDRDHDRDDRKEARDHDRDRHHARGDRDEDGDHDRDDRREPRGWRHGKKEGWKKSGCDLPPGLAKKDPDCGEARHHRDRDRDHDGDRDDDRVASHTPGKTTVRPRTTTVRPPVRNTVPPAKTVSKKPTHKIRNPAEMIDAKTGKVVTH